MKAIIEESNGLYLVRIHERNGSLCDIYVVDELELRTCDRNFNNTRDECATT